MIWGTARMDRGSRTSGIGCRGGCRRGRIPPGQIFGFSRHEVREACPQTALFRTSASIDAIDHTDSALVHPLLKCNRYRMNIWPICFPLGSVNLTASRL